MSAGRYDITVDQGSTLIRNLLYLDGSDSPIDLSGFTAALQVRETYTSGTAVLSLSSAGTAPEITLGGTTGAIAVSVPAITMAAIPAGVYVYDLELDDGGVVVKPVRGQFEVRPEVTR